MKSNLKRILVFLFVAVFLFSNVVYADTTAEISLCDYSGVRQTLKIVGLLLDIVKIIIPLLLIILSFIDFGKAATSGNADDLKKNTTIFFKRAIAGLIIFFLPSFINFIFDTLVDRDDSKFAKCAVCLTDYNNCDTDDSNDPDVNK